MKHDVTADPLSPEMRRWVDQAAEEVIRFMDGTTARPPRPTAPDVITEDTLSRSRREILDTLRTGATQATTAARCGVSRQYVGQVIAEFEAFGISCRPDGSFREPRSFSERYPPRRNDEAD